MATKKVKALAPVKAVKKTKPTKPAKALKAVKAVALALAFSLCTCGCVYKGAKVTEGTDLSVGIDVPSTEGTLQLQVLNFISGFRLGVAENAQLKMKYTVAETNDYLGVVTTRTYKSVDAEVNPCEDDTATSTVTAASAETK